MNNRETNLPSDVTVGDQVGSIFTENKMRICYIWFTIEYIAECESGEYEWVQGKINTDKLNFMCNESEYEEKLEQHKLLFKSKLLETYPHNEIFCNDTLGGRDTKRTFEMYIDAALSGNGSTMQSYRDIRRSCFLCVNYQYLNDLNEGFIIPNNTT